MGPYGRLVAGKQILLIRKYVVGVQVLVSRCVAMESRHSTTTGLQVGEFPRSLGTAHKLLPRGDNILFSPLASTKPSRPF